ncbi:transcriptional regulator, LacI family [Leptothrix cholodnii SP-6]|uniref:Transcriptional regulator, LacI family n=1 Tax=Leptothrix cholodnii (strain ATCC 51168 / LMG 8142 / SP-6) TaxID=395495 RepID=B1Y4V9_LEPCP|nr:LacI family DNA-binding transcriptional regulator [Leptothrix cholodnii]ACB34672.1 transcriptional regulator, LacI family [Leptothrix cholodnii SP-6]
MQPPSDPRIKKVTAKDVAERAGVSKWTVSRAFTDGGTVAPKVRERIRQIAAEMGYTPNLLARSLSTRSTRLIALVVDELGNFNQLRVLNEATRQMQARGYSTLLLNLSAEYGPAEAVNLADQFQVDGIVFLGTTLKRDLIELAQRIKHIPLVVILRNSGEADIRYVSTDGYVAGGEIADLFLSEGYRRIGYMAGPMSERTELRRMEGFRDRLKEAGTPLSLVLEASHYRRSEGLQTLQRYLEATPRGERIEALFCENDILAIGAMDALVATHSQRKIAIVGFDDIELGSSPSYELTTFRQPIEYLVSEALRRILDPDADSLGSLMAPGTLVMRQSHRRSAG